MIKEGVDLEEDKAVAGKMPDTIVDFLIHMPMFDSLCVEELEIVSKQMKAVEVDAGEVVFREGDRGDFVCFVVDGSLEVLKQAGTGDPVVLSRLRRNSSIGEMAVIDEFLRSATVKAITKSTLVLLSRRAFDRILNDQPIIAINMLKGISRLLSLNLRKTSSRLADYMLPLS